MECLQKTNSNYCNCTYSCDKHGICCKCLHYHRSMNELPACYFDNNSEKTYNRSIRFFVSKMK